MTEEEIENMQALSEDLENMGHEVLFVGLNSYGRVVGAFIDCRTKNIYLIRAKICGGMIYGTEQFETSFDMAQALYHAYTHA